MPRWRFEIDRVVLNLDAISRGDGVWLPRQLEATLDDSERPFIAKFRWRLDHESLEYECEAVELEARSGQQISSRDLPLPLTKLLGEVLAYLEVWRGPIAQRGTIRRDVPPDQDVGYLEGGPKQAKRPRRRLTPTFLREVAGVYRRAKREGLPQREAVAEHFREGNYKPSRFTARNWILAAREAGLVDEEGGSE